MSGYSDFLRDRSEEILARTEPSPEDAAEQAERARRNKLARIMAPPAPPLPEAPEKLTTPPASVSPAALEKRLRSMGSTLAKAFGKGMAEYVKKKVSPLVAEIEQNHRAYEAIGRIVDRLSNELSELKREAALAKRLAEQNIKRKSDLLELENSLLRAGRLPGDVRDDGEADLPAKFSEWNGGGHAQ